MMAQNDPLGPTVTHTEIEVGLGKLGLQRGDAVEVHSSLRSFGWVEGGATAVIDALMNVIGEEGALVMSAYPLSPAIPLIPEEIARGITWKCRKLSADSTEKTGLGAVVDEFKQRPDVVLGTGLHRVCAWGRDAHLHRQGYSYLLEIDGWTLLLGVNVHSCSSLHVAERVGIPEEVRRLHQLPDDIRQAHPADEWAIGYGGTPNDAWMTVWQEAQQRQLLRQQWIGQAACTLFKANALVTIYEDFLRSDPYTLFGVERDRDTLTHV